MQHLRTLSVCVGLLLSSPPLCQASVGGPPLESARYLKAVATFADRVMTSGRDVYGKQKSPLFVDGLHAETLEPVRWEYRGQTWILSNFANQQSLMRTLDGLTSLTGQRKYRQAAENTTAYVLKNLCSPNGLLYWGGHMAWDLDGDGPVGQYKETHELKNHQPYFELMWRVDPAATRRLIESIWATHVVNWSLLDYNRHASVKKELPSPWLHEFREDVEVPFPATCKNLAFSNVTPPLVRGAVLLATLDDNAAALTWSRRLVYRWQQARDPKTGLCGSQLSSHKNDRAQQALGHVYPNINEAKMVAGGPQQARYHILTVAQLQAGEALIRTGGRQAEVGRDFIRWAADDLATYDRWCYDPASGKFVARMTDGTPIDGKGAKSGYFNSDSFAPVEPDGNLFWSCALAYRLTGEKRHWQMAARIAAYFGLGDLGDPDGSRRAIRLDADCTNWQSIYALLDLHQSTGAKDLLQLAARIGDNLLSQQTSNGLFPRRGRQFARTGDEIPLALLHLAAAIDGKQADLPQAVLDSHFFHCEYSGPLEKAQRKRADTRTYDNLVFYGAP